MHMQAKSVMQWSFAIILAAVAAGAVGSLVEWGVQLLVDVL